MGWSTTAISVLSVVISSEELKIRPCISYRRGVCLSVRLSVCHSVALCQNEASWDHEIFTDETSAWESSLGDIRLIQKFERIHPERRR